MDARTLMRDDEFRRGYEEWLKNPVTVRIRELAEKAATPIGLGSVDGNNALYYHGQAVGWASFNQLVFEFVDTMLVQEKMVDMQTRLQPSYGAPRLVRDFIPENAVKKEQ